MKKTMFSKFGLCIGASLLSLAVLSSCQGDKESPSDTDSDTTSSTLLESTTDPMTTEPMPPEDETPAESETDLPGETETGVRSVVYPAVPLPDYAAYSGDSHIKETLSHGNTAVFAVNAPHYYRNGEWKDGGKDVLKSPSAGKLEVNGSALSSLYEGAKSTSGTPAEVAAAMGRNVVVYDNKLVVFYEGNTAPLQAFEDAYTLEAVYLRLTDAADEEIKNMFIDLPDQISNHLSNTVFYTAPDLNLGVQTSIYYPQLGQVKGVGAGPSLVCGEGRHPDNHTVVRVFNTQQTCTAQFLAFDASVTGGVQVAAAEVGKETLIATCPFASSPESDGDIRLFDEFGTLRMVISVREVLQGPYIIATGHFMADLDDEVLLVTASETNKEGKLPYMLISLSDGKVLLSKTMDCGMKAEAGISISTRKSIHLKEADALVIYIPEQKKVFEGMPGTGSFKKVAIYLPDSVAGVSPSNEFGEKYVLTLNSTEDDPNRSYIIVYDENLSTMRNLDVGFRENVFYSARYIDEYNDTRYVNRGKFSHIRVDLGNSVLGQLSNANSSEAVDRVFDQATYDQYFFNSAAYQKAMANEYMFLEPCFTHRWNKISATGNLIDYRDPVKHGQIHSSLGKSGEYVDYNELDSAFYIGTYSDGNLDLAKLRLYPIRHFLRGVAPAFRGEGAIPEHLVGMSPVHEHEINVDGSVGDYNVNMIEGFRAHLLKRYGSVEEINRHFGTSFADRASIDAPRKQNRGAWDAYEGEFFSEWALYNRYIVNKRIMEAYREALLAGYPPESISAHQIPEGEAVSGFLGQADTRLSPIDVVTTCGTAYGGTRYGTVSGTNCFLSLANNAGQNAISLGEYGSLTTSPVAAFKQLKFMWSRGLRMVHHITFNDAQSNAEKGAIESLIQENMPRPGYTGGTINSMGVSQEDKKYRIVQIGEGYIPDKKVDSRKPNPGNQVGLLKSVDENGKWEGTVYLVPFHAHVKVSALDALAAPKQGTEHVFTSGTLPTLKNSDQVEITFSAAYRGEGEAYVTFEVYEDDVLLPGSVRTYKLTENTTYYRYSMMNQLYGDHMSVVVTFHHPEKEGSMENIVLENLKGTVQQDAVGVKYFENMKAYRNSKSHKGGVTFDILSRDMKY